MTSPLDRLVEKWHAIHDLGAAQQLLEWDQQVLMPPRGAEQRSHQLAALARVVHERLTDPELGELLATLEGAAGIDEERRADLREARREHQRAVKIPADLAAERARAHALAQVAWQEARERSDFPAFRPHLETVLRLAREVASALGAANPYDALLDEFEPGMTEAELRPIFTALRARLVPLLERIAAAPHAPSAAVLRRRYPMAQQEAFCRQVMAAMGFDITAGRLDRSAHPFTSGTLGDVRLTTRYREDSLATALFGLIHEAGHGLYEQGLDPVRYRDPAGGHCSLGIHESQSRLWENLVGRSLPFWRHFYPLLQRTFPGTLDDVPLEDFYGAINVCQRSLIRVEADEVTYNLHIILRFELESALLAGTLQAADLPAAWAERTRELLDLEVPDARRGVLQDVHWSVGLFGYFPTYTLGNLYASQIMEQVRVELPDLDRHLAAGELRPLREWLGTKIHRHGRRYPAALLCQQATGAPLSSDPLIAHLERKYGELYRLA